MHTYSHSHAHWPFSSKDSAELNAVKWWASCHVLGEKVNVMLEVLLNQIWLCDFVLRENEWQTRERQSHGLMANDSEKPQILHLKGFKVFCFVFLENNGLNCQSGYQDNFPLFSKVKKTWVCKVANRSLEMRCVVGSDPAVVLTEWIAAAGWRQSGCVLGIFARLMRSKLEVLFMESTFSHLDCKITSRLPMNFSTWPPTQAIFSVTLVSYSSALSFAVFLHRLYRKKDSFQA